MEDSIGKYYSHEYTRRYILQQTEEEMKTIDEQIAAEKDDPRYAGDEEEMDGFDVDDVTAEPQPDEKEQEAEKEEPQED
jgi:hypothetical protein